MALKLSQLDGHDGFHLAGGSTVGGAAGDVNGDGIGDLIVGVPSNIGANSFFGAGYVVFGSTTPFPISIDLATLDGDNGFAVPGSYGDVMGTAVAGAGDVNGDGFDDVIIGVPGNWFDDVVGGSYVVFGSGVGFDASVDPAGLDGTNGFRMTGAVIGDGVGASVAGASDVNGDGFDDLIVGADGRYAYASYVVFGSATGFGANIDLAALDGTDGFRINAGYGQSVGNAGDVNGDGFADLLIGSTVVFGSGAGFPADFDAGSLDGTNGFRISGGVSFYYQPTYSSAGDINGDGIDDLVVGVPATGYTYQDYAYTPGYGATYVVFGSAAGFAAEVNVDDLNGSNGFRLIGDEGGLSGSSVAAAGDVNGDGIGDLLVSEPGHYGAIAATYVVFGSEAGFAASIDLATMTGAGGFRIDGSVGPVAGAGDVNGDGIDDLVIGGSHVVFGSTALGGANDAPTAADDSLTVVAGDAVDLAADNGGGSDRDPDFDTMTIAAINGCAIAVGDSVTLASGLRVTLLGGAEVRFDTLGFAAAAISDSFEYTISDGRGGFDTATATLDYTQDGLALSALDGSNGFRIDGIDWQAAGVSVASAGDINDDGTDDLIIGAPWTPLAPGDRYSTYAGQSYVVYGTTSGSPAVISLDTLDGSDGFRLGGDYADYAGYSVASAGDVNDDGIDDLIVGAPQMSEYGWGLGWHPGKAYVVYGTSAGLPAKNLSLPSLDGTNGFALVGVYDFDAAFNDGTGRSVAGAGDVNGDGIGDLVIGAPGGSFYTGTAYVVFGSSAGFAAGVDLTALDGSDGFRLIGAADDYAGTSVAAAGDVNGDGIDDLVVGAPGSGYEGGRSYVVFGSAAGFAADLDLTALDGSDGFRLVGLATGDYSGASVAGAGDVNGDGIDDLIVGGSHYAQPGAAYVVFGSRAGFGASLDLATLDGTDGFRIDGLSAGGLSLASAGDFNGDGINDLVVGVPGASQGGRERAGETYVVFGSSDGFSASLDLATLDGRTGIRLGGVEAGDLSGASVAAAGDVNADGFDDLIVGAPGVGDSAGASYVIYGFGPSEVATAAPAELQDDVVRFADAGADAWIGLG